MAAPEPVPRRGREREREDESEDESDILEESPCGRWQKRREQVGTAGRGGSPPTSGGGALETTRGRADSREARGPKPLRSVAQAAPFLTGPCTPLAWRPRPGEEPPIP